MKRRHFLLVIVLAVAIPFQYVLAQDLITAAETAKLMKNDNVIVVSTRTAADYQKVHINGAVHVNHSDLYKDGPVKNMLKNPSEIASILGSTGIGNSMTIILYDDGSGKYAGRLYWILDYLGATDVKILDGHMKAWRAARKPVTKNPTSIKAATFTAKPDKAKLATMSEVKGGASIVVDARTAEEFAGAAETKLRPGHIPGAVNVPHASLMDAKGMMKSKDELQSIFGAAGITKDKSVILYCESGVRAGILYFALKSILGYSKVKVYDGAYLEWQSVSSNQVAS